MMWNCVMMNITKFGEYLYQIAIEILCMFTHKEEIKRKKL